MFLVNPLTLRSWCRVVINKKQIWSDRFFVTGFCTSSSSSALTSPLKQCWSHPFSDKLTWTISVFFEQKDLWMSAMPAIPRAGKISRDWDRPKSGPTSSQPGKFSVAYEWKPCMSLWRLKCKVTWLLCVGMSTTQRMGSCFLKYRSFSSEQKKSGLLSLLRMFGFSWSKK